ncbi:MAG: hypothetical protein K9J17_08675 [Flavobacteriales bacterium]|nr:hypothetical protein [Flavobacteriales bacterium]
MEENSENQGVQLINISADKFVEQLKSGIEEFSCKRIIGNVNVRLPERTGIINFRECVFANELVVHIDEVNSIRFYNSEIKGRFYIESNKEGATVLFDACPSIFSIEAEDLRSSQITIRESLVENKIQFLTCHNASLYIRSSTIKGQISFDAYGLPLKMDQVRISSSECGNLSLSHGLAFERVLLESGTFSSISSHANIKQFQIIGVKNIIDKLLIDSFGSTIEVLVANAEIGTLTLDYEIGKSSFRLLNSKIKSSWNMKYAAPHELHALNLDLQDCSLYFDNTRLSNCVFSNVTWPKDMKLCSIHPENSKEKYASLRESYRQLKKAMLNDGNNFDSLVLYRNEMEAHWALVRHPKSTGLHQSFLFSRIYGVERGLQDWQNKFLLWLGYHVSDHGQSFMRPLFWLFVFHMFFFLIAIAVGYNGFYFTSNLEEWGATADFVGSYLYLLNPVHKLPDTHGGMLIVDFFMRLSSGFFIYHIIRASRKFAKV